MHTGLRKTFNENFSAEKYHIYMREIESLAPGMLDFRNAETPVFVPKEFAQKLMDAGESIIDVLVSPEFKTLTERSIPEKYKVPNEGNHPELMVMDFGVCRAADGTLEPQLIEMQGFPTLHAFQAFHTELTAEYAELPDGWSAYLNGYDKQKYLTDLKEILLGDHHPENVILMEIFPEQQKTRIDFAVTETITDIKTVCVTKVFEEGNKLYYMNDGVKTPIHRIYNRLIFDDLDAQQNLQLHFDFKKPYDVEWVPHPNWFYRISKFTLPFLKHKYVPETLFLNEVNFPVKLEDYVLKPLFSFAGMGVVIDVTQEDIDNIKDPENWILQKKVQYDPVIETLDEHAKAEIRIFYFWKKDWPRPIAVHNLARLSKGKMIGTRYNKDKEWVGGSVAYFEK